MLPRAIFLGALLIGAPALGQPLPPIAGPSPWAPPGVTLQPPVVYPTPHVVYDPPPVFHFPMDGSPPVAVMDGPRIRRGDPMPPNCRPVGWHRTICEVPVLVLPPG
jgi:hypothetical protein